MAKQIHNRWASVPTAPDLENSSLGWTQSHPLATSLPLSSGLQELFADFQRLLAWSSLPTNRQCSRKRPSGLQRRKGFFRTGDPAFVPGCHQPVIPPNHKRSGPNTPRNLNQAKSSILAQPLLHRTLRAQLRCAHACDAHASTLSDNRRVFNSILSLEINSDDGAEENP